MNACHYQNNRNIRFRGEHCNTLPEMLQHPDYWGPHTASYSVSHISGTALILSHSPLAPWWYCHRDELETLSHYSQRQSRISQRGMLQICWFRPWWPLTLPWTWDLLASVRNAWWEWGRHSVTSGEPGWPASTWCSLTLKRYRNLQYGLW